MTFILLTGAIWGNAKGQAQSIEYDDVDLATVRLMAVKGIQIQEIPILGTGQRSVAIPNVSHGSGIAVSADGLILTAHHVVEGALALAVKFPGDNQDYPAKVLYSDEERDFAILTTGKKVDHFLPITADSRKMHMREPVHAIGYPIDARLAFPLSSQGIIAGELPDGFVQLGMSLNPGNSGGPVIDSKNRLIAIVVARGDPTQGVLGLGLAMPVYPIVSVMHRVVALGQKSTPQKWSVEEKRLAKIAAKLVESGPVGMLREVSKLLRERNGSTLTEFRSQAATGKNTNFTVLTAAFLWDAVVMLTESGNNTPLSEARQSQVKDYLRHTIELCHSALKQDPDVTVRSSFVTFIVGQWPEAKSEPILIGQLPTAAPVDSLEKEEEPSNFQKSEEDGSLNSLFDFKE